MATDIRPIINTVQTTTTWVQVTPDNPERASFGDIIEEYKSLVDNLKTISLPAKGKEALGKFAAFLKKADEEVLNFFSALGEDKATKPYLKSENRVVKTFCKTPERTSFSDILKEFKPLIAKLKTINLSVKGKAALKSFEDFLKKADEEVLSFFSALGEDKATKPYLQVETNVVRNKCGIYQFPLPLISSSLPISIAQGKKNVEITLKGYNFPKEALISEASFNSFGDKQRPIWDALIKAGYISKKGERQSKFDNLEKITFKLVISIEGKDVPLSAEENKKVFSLLKETKKTPKVEFLINPNEADPKISVLEDSIKVSADGKTLTFKVNLEKDARLGERKIRVSNHTYPQLNASTVTGLTIKPGSIKPGPIKPSSFSGWNTDTMLGLITNLQLTVPNLANPQNKQNANSVSTLEYYAPKNLGFNLGFNPIYKHKDQKGKSFEFAAKLNLSYGGNYYTGGMSQTQQVVSTLDLSVKGGIEYVQAFLSGGYNFTWQEFQNPTHPFPNMREHLLYGKVGVQFSSDLKQWSLAPYLRFDYSFSNNDFTDPNGEQVKLYDARRYNLLVGAKLEVKHKNKFSLEVDGGYSAKGRTHVPYYRFMTNPDKSKTLLEDGKLSYPFSQWGMNASINVMNQKSLNLFSLYGGYTERNTDSWFLEKTGTVGMKVDINKAGKLDLAYRMMELYYKNPNLSPTADRQKYRFHIVDLGYKLPVFAKGLNTGLGINIPIVISSEGTNRVNGGFIINWDISDFICSFKAKSK